MLIPAGVGGIPEGAALPLAVIPTEDMVVGLGVCVSVATGVGPAFWTAIPLEDFDGDGVSEGVGMRVALFDAIEIDRIGKFVIPGIGVKMTFCKFCCTVLMSITTGIAVELAETEELMLVVAGFVAVVALELVLGATV